MLIAEKCHTPAKIQMLNKHIGNAIHQNCNPKRNVQNIKAKMASTDNKTFLMKSYNTSNTCKQAEMFSQQIIFKSKNSSIESHEQSTLKSVQANVINKTSCKN